MRRADPTDRREQMLDAGLRLVAEGGLQAVTHRSVERAVRLPHGSVTYYFGSRDELVAAMVDRLVVICERSVAEIARGVALALARRSGDEAIDVDGFAAALVAWADEHRENHLARMELELAAARDPRLRQRMSDAALVFWRLCEPLVVALGSADPRRDGRAMAASIDGLLLDRLAHEPEDPLVFRAAVSHLLDSWKRPAGA